MIISYIKGSSIHSYVNYYYGKTPRWMYAVSILEIAKV